MNRIFFAILIFVFSAHASAATLKIATVTPEGSQWMKDMKSSAAEIKERTQGRVQIKYYGGGVMGNDKKVLSRIRLGSLHGGAFTPTSLVGQYPDLSLYGLPLVFNSDEEAAYVRSRLDAKLEAGLEQAGYVNFGFAAGGFALLMSNVSRLCIGARLVVDFLQVHFSDQARSLGPKCFDGPCQILQRQAIFVFENDFDAARRQ